MTGTGRTRRHFKPQHLTRTRATLALPGASCLAAVTACFVPSAALAEQPARAANEVASAEILVAGERPVLEHVRLHASVASTVLSGESLHRAGQSASDVLARVPGVQIARTGAQSDLATASIRGSDSSQVPVYLAGIRINDEVTGIADLSTVPLWMIERVEVYRGNAPESADRLGMGGAIFFWPKQPRTTRLGASASAGSYGERAGWLAYEAGSERAGSIVAIRRAQADNDYPFLNDHGRRFDLDEVEERRKNADFVTHDAWVVGRYELYPGARLSLVAHAFDREQGVTGLSVIPAENARGTVRRYLAGASARLPCSVGDGCFIEAQASLLVGRLTLRDPFVRLPALRTRYVHGAGTRHAYGVRAQTEVSNGIELGVSATQSFEELEMTRLENLSRVAERATSRLAATSVWRPSWRGSVHALVAAECHTTQGRADRYGSRVAVDDDACGTSAVTGRLGGRVGVTSGLELLANAGRYIRVPTLGELYGNSPLVEGNPTLAEERGWTADAGIRADTALPSLRGRVSIESFAFVRYADGLIRFQPTGVNSAAPFNVSASRIIGLEAALGGELLELFRLDAAATLLDPKETTQDPVDDPTPNDVLTLTSRLVATVRAEIFANRGLAALAQDRAGLALTYLHRSARHPDRAGLLVLPAQNLFDVEASSAHFGARLLARFAVRNVFDTRQLDLLGLPVPGRSIHGELEAWF